MNVSIIIPVYNVEQYIEECLQSVIDQTHKGLDVILIDDCGGDNSITIAKSHIEKNGFTEVENSDIYTSSETPITITILHHTQNRGLSASRNTGIDAATGEYLFFLDSDDTIIPSCIEDLVGQTTLHPGVEMVQGVMYSNDEHLDDYAHVPINNYHVPEYSEGKTCRYLMQSGHLCSMVSNRLIKTGLIRDNQLYFKEGLIHEDDLWTFTAGKHIKSIAVLNKETYFYRHNKKSIMQHLNVEKSYNSVCFIADKMIDQLPKFQFFFTGLHYALCTMQTGLVNTHLNPLDGMKWGKNFFIKTIFNNWNKSRIKKTVAFALCASGFWVQQLFSFKSK